MEVIRIPQIDWSEQKSSDIIEKQVYRKKDPYAIEID